MQKYKLISSVILLLIACGALAGVYVSAQASSALDAQSADTVQSEWVKIESPLESSENSSIDAAKPTGKKMIPVADELAPANQLLKLERHKGKVVYLDFWASWCVPCRDSFPFMNKMQEKYKDDLVVIGVNLDEDPLNAERFLKQYPANFEIIYDQFWQAGREYGIYGLPYSFVYNRKGELVGKHGGFKPADVTNLDVALQNLIELGE